MVVAAPFIMIAAAVVAAAGTVYAAQQSAQAQKAQGKMMKQQAEYTRLRAAGEESDYRRRQAALMATRRALMGGSGVDGGTGTALLVDADAAGEIEYNALKIRSGGEAEAIRLENQSSLLRQQARSTMIGGYISAGSSLLQGASSAAGSWEGGGTPTYATTPAYRTGAGGTLAGPV